MLQASTKCVCAKTKAVHDSLRHLEAIFLQSQDIHVKDITTAQDHVRNMLRSVTPFFSILGLLKRLGKDCQSLLTMSSKVRSALDYILAFYN